MKVLAFVVVAAAVLAAAASAQTPTVELVPVDDVTVF
jgi:hypothetical protein